jgi:Protein of unknown function (DUF1460)
MPPANNFFFIGDKVFQTIAQRAIREGWNSLPIDKRIENVGLEFLGTRYVDDQLEIDEAMGVCYVSLLGFNCITFIETILALARLLGRPPGDYNVPRLIREVKSVRYRKGPFKEEFLSRLHDVKEWLHDNETKGIVHSIHKEIKGVSRPKIHYPTVSERWQSFRPLRENPALLPRLRVLEKRTSRMPFYYLPISQIASAEPRLKTGDIVAFVDTSDNSLCTHVGAIVREASGNVRLLQASPQSGKVLMNSHWSDYLKERPTTLGISVARPQ